MSFVKCQRVVGRYVVMSGAIRSWCHDVSGHWSLYIYIYKKIY